MELIKIAKKLAEEYADLNDVNTHDAFVAGFMALDKLAVRIDLEVPKGKFHPGKRLTPAMVKNPVIKITRDSGKAGLMRKLD